MTDTATTTTTTDAHPIAKASVLFLRIVQLALAGLAAMFVAGGLIGGMNVLQFAAIGVLALVLLGFVGVVEILVRGVRRWVA